MNFNLKKTEILKTVKEEKKPKYTDELTKMLESINKESIDHCIANLQNLVVLTISEDLMDPKNNELVN